MTAPDASQGDADVYITNAHPCSAGTGPGYATLPWAEAKQLVDQGYACWGNPPAARCRRDSRAGEAVMTMPSYEAASNAVVPPPPPEQLPDDGDLVEVFVTVAVRCSDGSHHGVHRVGRAEAARLIALRQAVAGHTPPRGFNLEA